MITAFEAVRRDVELDSRVNASFLLLAAASALVLKLSVLDRTEGAFAIVGVLLLGLARGFTWGSPPTMGARPGLPVGWEELSAVVNPPPLSFLVRT